MNLAVSTQASPEMEKRLAGIKLIALDLDGTTLTREGLTRRTKDTLEEAMERGIDVVIATGRVFSALPEKIHKIKGLRSSYYRRAKRRIHLFRLCIGGSNRPRA